jgi:hypothetical protein
MKQILLTILLPVALLSILASAAPAPDAKDHQQLLVLIKEVQNQQAEIVANQTKIDAKLADLAETIRVARIFSSRAR